jgi:hypothetical protein
LNQFRDRLLRVDFSPWHSAAGGQKRPVGVLLILAARDPLANLSLIWFTVWSSAVHGGIMTVQAVTQPGQMGHLAGDVLALFIVAVALAILTPARNWPTGSGHTTGRNRLV